MRSILLRGVSQALWLLSDRSVVHDYPLALAVEEELLLTAQTRVAKARPPQFGLASMDEADAPVCGPHPGTVDS